MCVQTNTFFRIILSVVVFSNFQMEIRYVRNFEPMFNNRTICRSPYITARCQATSTSCSAELLWQIIADWPASPWPAEEASSSFVGRWLLPKHKVGSWHPTPWCKCLIGSCTGIMLKCKYGMLITTIAVTLCGETRI